MMDPRRTSAFLPLIGLAALAGADLAMPRIRQARKDFGAKADTTMRPEAELKRERRRLRKERNHKG